MKTPVILLLTNDNGLEDLVADALSAIGGVSHLTRDAGDALETVCGVHDLDLAVIDFEHGPHGMTLLSAISTLREDLPVIVITQDDEKHVEELAYANGANQGRNRSLPDRGESENANNESQRFSRTKQDQH